jgi:hypothetical protein
LVISQTLTRLAVHRKLAVVRKGDNHDRAWQLTALCTASRPMRSSQRAAVILDVVHVLVKRTRDFESPSIG